MASQEKGRPLPKFGEWDVNNPASAEGFTVIFSKARDEKKSNGAAGSGTTNQKNDNNSANNKPGETYDYPPMKKWFCCF
ncbi:RIN4, pathogenic type III effector avirulence factor Avr cleavage site [Trema orientale]|uniref:RIN4, pathogenic type III effector avirulence factor Avr cleavage site n=1 Tax=Trema orientale TaxID=63057 RepID=A0A2P5FBR6_TREOI|nr:RIN4, pathogenic type III effector avirulence factor Avr cleavage site [Trema orientale]